MSPELDRHTQRILATAQRAAAPRPGDRERISSALRARLDAAMVEGTAGGMLAAGSTAGATGAGVAAAQLGRGGWIGVVMVTSVLTGALGFGLGYGLRHGGDPPVPVSSGTLLPPRTAEAPARYAEGVGMEGAVVEGGADSHSAAAKTVTPPMAREASPRERAPEGAPARSGEAASPRTKDNHEADWPFAEVLERLHRANLALRRGQASLALIQLAELDRRAGEVLREEREVTRVLALCASGETQAARRAAAPLHAGSAQSIYAHRLERSCVREP